MKLRSTQFAAISFFICNVYLFLSYMLYTAWLSPNHRRSVNLQYVVVHIDLKGAPPKLEYLNSLLPMMKEYGVNALLMEYEDMFPYEGALVNLSAKYRYSRTKLHRFLSSAHQLDIEIIPLIQTFGHMEHVLKLEEFQQLREDPEYPDSICPSKIESRSLVKEMLEQVINFHNNITHLKHIHVGCDEVYQINKCQDCLSRGASNADLYIEYIRHISNIVTKLSPDTRVLVWDDMLRQMRPPAWTKIECFNNIEPVYWTYSQKVNINHVSFNHYHKKFKNIWAASAFKGADGITAVIPDLNLRLSNHLEWMKVLQDIKIAGERNYFNFKGIILTGWSRYSHMHPLCELLPVSIPSLILNLRLVKTYKSDAIPKQIDLNNFFNKYLSESDNYLTCEINLQNIYVDGNCNFDGVSLYKELTYFLLEMDQTYSFIRNDWSLQSTNGYYYKSNYIFMYSLDKNINACTNALDKLSQVEKKIALSMTPYFESYVIDEYLGYHFYDIRNRIKYVLNVLQQFVNSQRVWGRRDQIYSESIIRQE